VSKLLAIDVAILPTPAVRERAVELSASLPASESHGLRLDDEHLPHVTLSQHFIRVDERALAFEKIDEVLRGQKPLKLVITGGGKSSSAVSMAIDNTPQLQKLHERLMEALRGVERAGATPAAFFGGDARMGDVLTVSSYRVNSSFTGFSPHLTLGHALQSPVVERLSFQASIVAACHLGRFCACRQILRSWTL
jgi:2'-5' RNA ligase superfamily protein